MARPWWIGQSLGSATWSGSGAVSAPDSEVSIMNRDRWAHVSIETRHLVDRAVRAWTITGGRFDPTMERQLVAAGYDRPFSRLPADADGAQARVKPSAGCGGIVFDPFTSTIHLPGDVHLDLGGIGKGFAADLVTAELLLAGAIGALVNLGGDLRVRTSHPGGGTLSDQRA